ncbi:STM3941 family protein [Brevundimonas sp. 1080]|uniref:STM3941 family protein n=1 Tax=Brevundimonas sp. 1080 TaxID=3156405 RepID=UPI003390A307
MNDFVAYTSRSRIVSLVARGLIFVTLSLWLIGVFGTPPDSRRYSPVLTPFIGWGGLLFSVTATALWLRNFFERREMVRIGPAGIMVRWWSADTIPWNEITEIAPLEINGVKSISLKLRDREQYPPRGLGALLARGDRLVTGGDVTISLSATDRRQFEALVAIDQFKPTVDQSSCAGIHDEQRPQ